MVKIENSYLKLKQMYRKNKIYELNQEKIITKQENINMEKSFFKKTSLTDCTTPYSGHQLFIKIKC